MASVRTHARKTRRREIFSRFSLPRISGADDNPLHTQNTHKTQFLELVVRLSSACRPPIGGPIFVGGLFLLVGVVRLEAPIRVRLLSISAQTRPLALPSHVCGGRARACPGVGRRAPTALLRREKGNSIRRKRSQKPYPDCMPTVSEQYLHENDEFVLFPCKMTARGDQTSM